MTGCDCLSAFPSPTSRYIELAINVERHGTLYRCRRCGKFFELIAEAKGIHDTPLGELRQGYPDVDFDAPVPGD